MPKNNNKLHNASIPVVLQEVRNIATTMMLCISEQRKTDGADENKSHYDMQQVNAFIKLSSLLCKLIALESKVPIPPDESNDDYTVSEQDLEIIKNFLQRHSSSND